MFYTNQFYPILNKNLYYYAISITTFLMKFTIYT